MKGVGRKREVGNEMDEGEGRRTRRMGGLEGKKGERGVSCSEILIILNHSF